MKRRINELEWIIKRNRTEIEYAKSEIAKLNGTLSALLLYLDLSMKLVPPSTSKIIITSNRVPQKPFTS